MTPDMPTLDGAVAGTAREFALALDDLAAAVSDYAIQRRALASAVVANDRDLRYYVLAYYEAQRRYTDTRERVRRAEGHFSDACNDLVYGSADAVRGGEG